MSSPLLDYEFETLAVQRFEDSAVLEVAINRPEKLNAMSNTFFADLKRCLEKASTDPEVRCVIIHGGTCRLFCAGLDLNNSNTPKANSEASRKALKSLPGIGFVQDSISSLEKCQKPVIVAMHNAVVGGGIDLACAGDIRYCTEDTYFIIAEVNIGIAADLGTLQRLPKVVGNDSVVRELALTGRKLTASEALSLGLVGKILPNQEACLAEARLVARNIASKSPVAVVGTKASLTYSRDHTVQEGLDHVKLWNSFHMQSEDVAIAIRATLTKDKNPQYSKL
eukprot:CAMPEP_0194490184 /NCGR_PEP_ID=MMETSP0253-20130528/9484_1 /TAXON_ID=2966 /ORGANISM="Noctiluca scintillans" /LENGTH=280 /DNA_ID=CAMNT_0039330779 /DNA_START=46 /DNA_END=888 /DNA_ORIENTATION=-